LDTNDVSRPIRLGLCTLVRPAAGHGDTAYRLSKLNQFPGIVLTTGIFVVDKLELFLCTEGVTEGSQTWNVWKSAAKDPHRRCGENCSPQVLLVIRCLAHVQQLDILLLKRFPIVMIFLI